MKIKLGKTNYEKSESTVSYRDRPLRVIDVYLREDDEKGPYILRIGMKTFLDCLNNESGRMFLVNSIKAANVAIKAGVPENTKIEIPRFPD